MLAFLFSLLTDIKNKQRVQWLVVDRWYVRSSNQFIHSNVSYSEHWRITASSTIRLISKLKIVVYCRIPCCIQHHVHIQTRPGFSFDLLLFMVALCNRSDHYIFALLFLSSIFFLFLAQSQRPLAQRAAWSLTQGHMLFCHVAYTLVRSPTVLLRINSWSNCLLSWRRFDAEVRILSLYPTDSILPSRK